MIRIVKSDGTRLKIRKNGALYIARLFNSIYKEIVSLFKVRVLSDGGNFEAETNLDNQLNTLGSDLFNSASLVITPNGVKTSKLYAIKPNDGTGNLSVVRNTSATRINESGNIVNVPANVARIDYSNGSPAILVEPQRTNLIVRSEEFENASWQKYNSSIIPNATISPSGLMNADKLVENNLLATHHIVIFTGGTGLRTNSIFVKAGERSRFILWAGACGYMFDLINLTTTPGNNSPAISNTSIQDYGNGWYRCSITTKDIANNGYRISLLDNKTSPLTPTPKYQGDGVSGLYIWGAQRENASSLTSYIPTTTATVTRNADVISKTGLSGITSITENFENGTTNVISGSPTSYTMSQGRIKQVLGL